MTLNKIFLLAILIRLLVSPFFYHPDIKSQHFHFQLLSKGVFNIYQYIFDNKDNLPYRDTFNYLPLTYYTFGTIQAILSTIMTPDFPIWLNDWSANQNKYTNLPYILLILKLPYLILDLFLGYLLFKISGSKKILYLWLFNPISFYLIYILQNFDILPAFLTLLAYYLIKSKPNLSFLILGIAISLKLYPLILLPFFLLSLSKNPYKYVKYTVIALIPILLSITPFILNHQFWQSFLGSGLTQKIYEFKFNNIPIFPLLYAIILMHAFFAKKYDLIKYILYTFLLFISTVNFHPQWLLWFFPFIFLLNNVSHYQIKLKLYLLILLIAIYILLFNDNYLTFGHLIAIDPEFLNVTSPYNIFRYRFLINPQLIQNYTKTLIGLTSFFLLLTYEKYCKNHLS